MSRGSTLSTLRSLLRAELRDNSQSNTEIDAEYNLALASKQRDFALMFDWVFLRHQWDLACAAGSRYLNIPTSDTRGQSVTINFERPVQVSRLFSSFYTDITKSYGITEAMYNLHEGTSEPQDPIQAWQFSTNVNEASNANQIEIWPVPSTAQTLRFTGQRNVRTLSSDSDTADLDDLLLVYWVAADYLLMRGQPNAPLVLKKAQDHLTRLRASYPTPSCPPVILGRNLTRPRMWPNDVPFVVVAAAPTP